MDNALRDKIACWISAATLNSTELQELFQLMIELPEDEMIAEALENCKATASNLPLLEQYLRSTDGDQVYWAATFLGRLGTSANASQDALTELVCNTEQPASARQRALWAIQQVGDLDDATHEKLQALDCAGDPRMKRLLDQILNQTV